MLSMSGAGEWDMRTQQTQPLSTRGWEAVIFCKSGMAIAVDRSGTSRYPRGEKGIDSRVHMKED